VLEHWEQVLSQWRVDSDLSRFNRGDPASADLERVIRLAEAARDASGGAFDHHILKKVHAAGYGPPGTGIDLSAIGKGFAVDRATEAILAIGAKGGTVNAGGDLRIFGDTEEDIYLRAPGNPEHLVFAGRLHDGACATSATYYSRFVRKGTEVSPLVDPRSRQPLVTRRSYSVIAPRCVVADALTKVLALSGNPDLPCFKQYQAHPFIVEPSRVLP
jgi:thiamine biosynthesis lipoprotein